MNLSEFVEDDNSTFNATVPVIDGAKYMAFQDVVGYICMALGIPGNILSEIVWLRLHVARKNSSAVYLAALAINDLAFLAFMLLAFILVHFGMVGWFAYGVGYLYMSTRTVEPLLVLGFSVERLLAICWPLQVNLHYRLDVFYMQNRNTFCGTKYPSQL